MALYTTTALQIIQKACSRLGLTQPNAALSSTDLQTIQLVALANEEGEELSERFAWQSLQTETTFTTLAANLQGNLTTIAPGFRFVCHDTMWNRNTRIPIRPIDERTWQTWKATGITGPYSTYRIQLDAIYFIPTPTAGHTIAFEYQDRRWCMSSDELTKRTAFSADGDLCRIDPELITLGVIWRFKASKGLEYGEDFAKYEKRVMNTFAKDGIKPNKYLNGAQTYSTGISVPEGSWSL